ncbi:unnamed protein product [Amaranthus hypochondriacus]
MAPTQANRLDVLESQVQELRDSIPALKQYLEDRIQDIVALQEESMWQSKEENSKNHEELKSSITMLTAEVKALLLAKDNPANQLTQTSTVRSNIFLNGGGFEMPTPSHPGRE